MAITVATQDARGKWGSVTELWNTHTGRLVANVGTGRVAGRKMDGRFVVEDETSACIIDAADGTEIARWPFSPQSVLNPAYVESGDRFIVRGIDFRWPSSIQWLLQRLSGQPINPMLMQSEWVVYDARTGRSRGQVPCEPQYRFALAPDGKTLAVPCGDGLRVWDIPPKKPGGLILALMIAEVSLLIAWAMWRRRIAPKGRHNSAQGVSPG